VVWPVLPTVGPAPASCAVLPVPVLQGPAWATLTPKTTTAQQASISCFVNIDFTPFCYPTTLQIVSFGLTKTVCYYARSQTDRQLDRFICAVPRDAGQASVRRPDALEIKAVEARRLAGECDAAQERGEVAKSEKSSSM
jgi:hypothetical protein